MKAILWGAALALPLAGLTGSWAITHSRAQQGTDWDVPIRGYDPRDLLRGHYITFQYDWPGLKRDDQFAYVSALCITGRAPAITSASELDPAARMRCDTVAKVSSWGQGGGLEQGIFYVPQTAAAGYEDKLRDTKLKGILRVRIRDDGLIMPKSLSFRPKTAAEIAAEQAEAREEQEMIGGDGRALSSPVAVTPTPE